MCRVGLEALYLIKMMSMLINTVVLGEGISKYQIPPHFGVLRDRILTRNIGEILFYKKLSNK